MSDFSNIIQEINTNLPDNNTQAITAAKLRTTLIDLTETIEDQQDAFETTMEDAQEAFETEISTEVANTAFETLQKVNEVSIVNDVTTGGANDVLSAQQGVVLKEGIDSYANDLNNLETNVIGDILYDDTQKTLNPSNFSVGGILYSSSVGNPILLSSSSSYRYYIYGNNTGETVTPGEIYKINNLCSPVSSTQYTNLVAFTKVVDSQDIVVSLTCMSYNDGAPHNYDNIVVPATADKMYIMWRNVQTPTLFLKTPQKIYDILEENIDDIATLESTVSTNEANIEILNEEVGNIEVKPLPTENTYTDHQGARTQWNATYNVYTVYFGSSSTSYGTITLDDLQEGDLIYYRTFVGFSASYPYYLYFSHYDETAQLWVRDAALLPRFEDGSSTGWFEGSVKVPAGATRAWLTFYGTTAQTNYNNGNFTLNNGEYYDLQSQINDKITNINPEIMTSNEDWMKWESDWYITENVMDNIYSGTGETTPYNTWIAAASGHTGITFRMACISDTHGSGAYTWRNLKQNYSDAASCYRSIAMFNKVLDYKNGFLNCAMHGGDISCDYGTSRKRDLTYMYDVMRKFHWTRNTPLFITKGNHDENNNAYCQVDDYSKLDWGTNHYYTRSFSTFTETTEANWDGSPLFVAKTELVSDTEFKNTVQNWLSPTNKQWGPGAYYFYDFPTQKIRFIVANSFPVKDDYTAGDNDEYVWFGNTALNLSTYGADATNWSVIVIRHTECSSQSALVACLNAFEAGTTWTYTSGTTTITQVDFGEQNGGGCTVIAHIHGHEHGNNVANDTGIIDIGVNWASVNLSNLGNATYYGLNLFSFDLTNKLIYQDDISGQHLEYNYNNKKILLPVGQSINLSRNGLGTSVVPTSSNTSVLAVGGSGAGAYATGVAVGTADVTMTAGELTKVYHFEVIA